MTSTDRNDLMPAQEKLEWVTPKISLMGAGDTEGKVSFYPVNEGGFTSFGLNKVPNGAGPS